MPDAILRNQLSMMRAIGLIIHHLGHLQELIDQVRSVELSDADRMAASDERLAMIDELIARKQETELLLGEGLS